MFTRAPKIKLLNISKGFILGIVVILGMSAIAWNGPVSAPPNYNAYAPINISAASQTKSGALWAGSFLTTGGGYFGGNLQVVGECTGCVPSGSITQYAGNSAPTGWLLCDGSAVSRTTYAALFTVIGTTYGTGDGSTTFNLPDIRGRVAIGAGQGSGLTNRTLASTGGEEMHTLTVAEMPSHNHFYWRRIADLGGSLSVVTDDSADGETRSSSYAGGGQAHNIMQPFLVLNCIIKT